MNGPSNSTPTTDWKVRVLAGPLSLLAVAASEPHAPVTRSVPWEPAPPLPAAIAGHVACPSPNGILIAGGTSWDATGTKHFHDELWSYTPASTPSCRPAGKLPSGLGYAAAGAINDRRLFVAGGTDGSSSRATVAEVTIRGDAIDTKTLPDLPAPTQMAGGAVVAGRSLYVIGGTADPAKATALAATAWRLDLDAVSPRWTPLPQLPGGGRMLHAVVACGGRVYVFGGMVATRDGQAMADSDAAFCFDPERSTWGTLNPLPAPRRVAAAVALDDRHILILGGCRNEGPAPHFLSDALIYDTERDVYRPAPPLPYAAAGMAAAVSGGSVYVCGGEDRPRGRTDRVVTGRVTTFLEAGND